MGIIGDITGGIGDILGAFSSGGSDDAANNFYRDLIAKMQGINPSINGEQAAPSDQSVPQDVIRELQQTYRSGGLDSIARSQIGEATAGANRNAQANREAVLAGARARGGANSGVTAALQEMGGQDATQDANLASARGAATAESNRMNALGGAGTLGIQSAAAQDAINRFNASMRQNASQQTFGNKMSQLYGEGDLYGGAWKAGQNGEARTSRLYSGIGRMIGSAADATPPWQKNSIQP